MSDYPSLSSEAVELVRRQVFAILLPTGIFLTVISFAVGFFINDWARGAAYADAYSEAFKSSFKSIEDVSKSIAIGETAINAAVISSQSAVKAAGSASQEAKEIIAQLKATIADDQFDQIAEQVSVLVRNDADFVNKLNRLNNFVPGTILINIQNANCPNGFSSSDSISVDVKDRGRLQTFLIDQNRYDEGQNIADRDAAAAGHDAVWFYSCMKD